MSLLLLHISIPEVRRHCLRYLLTGAAIVLGVAIFSAAQVANASLRTALRDTVDRIAGSVALQVTAGGAGVAESLVDLIGSAPGVRAVAPVVEEVVESADPEQGNILILGIDLSADRGLRDYEIEEDASVVSDPLIFLSQPESLIVAKNFADRNGLDEGDLLTLSTAVGPRNFTVRGIMVPRGVALAFGGNIAVMDIYSAQFLFGRGTTFDRIDIALDESVGLDAARTRIQALAPGLQVDSPLRRGRQTESLIEAFAMALLLSSAIALFVGTFLIFNAFSVSVAERRRQIGMLRALGATRRQVRSLFLAEGALLGVAGSSLGLLFGILLGRIVIRLMAGVVEQTYGVPVSLAEFDVRVSWMTVALAAGVFASVLGAFLPARAAAAADPAVAVQRGRFQRIASGRDRLRRWAGVLLLGLALILGSALSSRGIAAQVARLATMFAGLVLLVPTFNHLVTGLLRRPLEWSFGATGRLAVDSVLAAPRRTNATVAALMLSLTCVVTSASLSSSLRTSLLSWIDGAVNTDLIVTPEQNLAARSTTFPEAMQTELEAVPGVEQVELLRIITLAYRGGAPLLMSLEMEKYLRRASPILEEGRLADLVPGMLNTNRVVVSNNFARAHELGVGDELVLDTPAGAQEFEIVGVQVDYNSDQGTVLVDRRTYKRFWNDDRVNTFNLMVAPGVDQENVRREIHSRFAGKRRIFILTNTEFRSDVRRNANQFWVLTYVQVFVAIVVAVLGIVNALTVSVVERRREIGIIRSLGGSANRVHGMVALEAACVGMAGIVLGGISGATIGHHLVGTVAASVTGWTFPYEMPVGVLLGMVPVTLALSLLAAWYPASLAARTPIVEAIACE